MSHKTPNSSVGWGQHLTVGADCRVRSGVGSTLVGEDDNEFALGEDDLGGAGEFFPVPVVRTGTGGVHAGLDDASAGLGGEGAVVELHGAARGGGHAGGDMAAATIGAAPVVEGDLAGPALLGGHAPRTTQLGRDQKETSGNPSVELCRWMLNSLALRVAVHHLLAQGEFQVGDPILYGKYKNKRGVIVRVFNDEKGHPTLEVEPVPKGRKQNKLIGLYKIWHDPNPPQESSDVKTASPTLVERVAQRYLASALHWKKFPGGAAKIGIIGGPYAKTEDGRFMIFVRRYLQGQPGDRSYAYHFSAVDYSIPSKGNRWTDIPIHMGGFANDHSSNPKTVVTAVEKWAHEHPLPPPEPKAASTEQYDDHDFDE